MQMKNRTKIMFANTLEEMLQTMPLEKVRVAGLCKKCGATTPTFYYYFHDKYELVAWMFLQDFAGGGRRQGAGVYGRWLEPSDRSHGEAKGLLPEGV